MKNLAFLILFGFTTMFIQGCPAAPPQNAIKAAVKGVYDSVESTFVMPVKVDDPFDPVRADVRVRIAWPGHGDVLIPAFYDGGEMWRVRFTPDAAGNYRVVGLMLNGKKLGDVKFTPTIWQAAGKRRAGFVRVSNQNSQRFVFDDGTPYFPLGHNQAWHTGSLPDIPEMFGKMRAAGENWSRVWMNHWDNKNLDWPRPTGGFGVLNLEVAQRWDQIVKAADQNGIFFQMVFQHHGQYSTQVNPNWDDNPYNVKNGGFLQNPEEFFNNQRAKELTKRKLRYAIARWGYSPSVMAWELWNEVQFTDAGRNGNWGVIAVWHQEMADYVRSIDVHRHLITTSSSDSVPAAVWESLDYIQEHSYPPDLLSAMHEAKASFAPKKPFFVGEFGPANLKDENGIWLHVGLWASLMSGQGGAAQYWTWDEIERHNLYSHFQGASQFVKAAKLASRPNLKPLVLDVSTQNTTDLTFSPGAGWTKTAQHEFQIQAGQVPRGIGALPQFLQGNFHRELSPQPLRFHVKLSAPNEFAVRLNQVAKAGADIKINLNGSLAVQRNFAPRDNDWNPAGDEAILRVPLSAGTHVLTLENSGNDWVTIGSFSLSHFSPTLSGFALADARFVAGWVYHRQGITTASATADSGRVTIPRLQKGRYRVRWLDTISGAQIKTETLTVATQTASLTTPAVSRDVAFIVEAI